MQFRVEAERRVNGPSGTPRVTPVGGRRGEGRLESGCRVDRPADVHNGSHPSLFESRERFDELVGHQPVPACVRQAAGFARPAQRLPERDHRVEPRQPPLDEVSFGPSQRDGVRPDLGQKHAAGPVDGLGRLPHAVQVETAGRADEHDQRTRVDRGCDQVGLAGRGVDEHPRVRIRWRDGDRETVGDQYVERQRVARGAGLGRPERRTALRVDVPDLDLAAETAEGEGGADGAGGLADPALHVRHGDDA